MQLICLGSGSSGNCYILEDSGEALIIEAGVPLLKVKKALNFKISGVVGAVVSHSHGDHAGRLREYENAGIPVFKPYEGKSFLQTKRFGNFEIRSFDLVHDVPCCGFLIEHPSMGRLLYASDTAYIKYRFERLNHILVEANYSIELADRWAENMDHVLAGHMELQTTLDFLRVNSGSELNTVMLCHLSERNGDEAKFAEAARNVVGPACAVKVAKKGITINIGRPTL